MSHIRAKNTTPELTVRRLVYSLGFRYRLYYKKLPGKPDLAFPGRKKVIFVHGCFWHGHENCPKGKLPKSNVEFWEPKITKNKARDAQIKELIISNGWKVEEIWQCELKDLNKLEKKITSFLK